MKLTNLQITNYINAIKTAFTDAKQYLPVKVNFAIQKNTQALMTLVQEVEQARLNIITHYGKVDEASGTIKVPEASQAEALKEINELYSIEQEVNIMTVKLDAFGDLSLSLEQLNAIMFMIEEE